MLAPPDGRPRKRSPPEPPARSAGLALFAPVMPVKRNRHAIANHGGIQLTFAGFAAGDVTAVTVTSEVSAGDLRTGDQSAKVFLGHKPTGPGCMSFTARLAPLPGRRCPEAGYDAGQSGGNRHRAEKHGRPTGPRAPPARRARGRQVQQPPQSEASGPSDYGVRGGCVLRVIF
jgi:hypothetical protein